MRPQRLHGGLHGPLQRRCSALEAGKLLLSGGFPTSLPLSRSQLPRVLFSMSCVLVSVVLHKDLLVAYAGLSIGMFLPSWNPLAQT